MADDEKILGIKKSELTELVRQILAEMPTSLPANGGNADYADNAGNADTVGGKSADDFAEYKPYAPIYVGNLLDITEMGTYSCNVDDTPNLPYGVESWCYVTMINFVSSGYKRYICTPFNCLSSYNNTLYLASEADKDSDGNLIWKELSTNPAKSVQVVGTTDNIGNFILWNSSENRKPVFITFADHYVIPFLSSNGNYYAHVLSAATDEQLTGTAVTATVFYIEI